MKPGMTPAINTDTIEGYTEWVATLSAKDLQEEIDVRSFDTEQDDDAGQWGDDYRARFNAAQAEQNRRADADPLYFNSDRD
jgi:hypothetical protein